MAIIETITDSSKLYHALQQTGGYKDNFSYSGAHALQAYLDNLSEETGEDIEFDPIAWCVEYTEYENALEAVKETSNDEFATEEEALEYLNDNTSVITFDSGIIIQDF